MPNNLSEIDALRNMKNITEQLTDYYVRVRKIVPNSILDNLVQYNIDLEDLIKKLEYNSTDDLK